ncbi:MarR family winged helix-turn-helix transcriptional regulator [Nocardioides dongkuii]|uniref:MarR family winged helix-turn-helix transcriptional regulator n=1 Tax=Nocardioides dongkuii TaxID=2760089 RepID=UPI0015FE0B86|nr:MarR family transcriptional regulator [Nocardioides dongkuii]
MTSVDAGRDSRRAAHLVTLENEVGVLVRRVRRVLGVRARAVHPQLQPAAYLMLAYLDSHGPMRSSAMAEVFDIDKGAISRQVQHLVDLGLVDRTPDPADGRAALVSASGDAATRLAEVASMRRRLLDDKLGDWSEEELGDFAAVLGRYNAALNG